MLDRFSRRLAVWGRFGQVWDCGDLCSPQATAARIGSCVHVLGVQVWDRFEWNKPMALVSAMGIAVAKTITIAVGTAVAIAIARSVAIAVPPNHGVQGVVLLFCQLMW